MTDIFLEKYRPTNLTEILSQDHIITILNNMITSNKYINMIFYGQGGCGKTSTAHMFAKKMYGDDYQNNIIEINSSDDRGVNIIKNVVKTYCYGESIISHINNNNNNKIKLIILDEADGLTEEAQNNLIKLLELNNIIFCIICNYLGKIIEPIISRCVILNFNSIGKKEHLSKLIKICEIENINLTKTCYDYLIDNSNNDFRYGINSLQLLKTIYYNEIIDDIK